MEQYRILIVEDSRELARVMSAAIRSLGEEFEVAEVLSGEEALLEIYREPYDLAIIDLFLPGMDGVKFAKRLHKALPDAKIIMISGVDEEKLKKGAQEVGAQAWFTKPLELADLLDTIERQLGLVESVLGDLPGLTPEGKRASHRIADLVAELRDRMDAKVVAILDEVGSIVLQAGDFGDSHTPSHILPEVVAAYDAALKVTDQFLDESLPKNLMAFESEGTSIYVASVDYRYALLAVCDAPCDEEKGEVWATMLSDTVEELRNVLEGIGVLQTKRIVPISEPAREPVEDFDEDEEEMSEEVDSPEVAPLLQLLEKSDVLLEQADEFWDKQAAREELLSPVNPKALSYEQAGQLGLVHPEDAED